MDKKTLQKEKATKLDIKPIIPSDYKDFLTRSRAKATSMTYHYYTKDYVLKNGDAHLSLNDLKKLTSSPNQPSTEELSEKASTSFKKLLRERNHPAVEIEFIVDENPLGRIVVEVFFTSRNKL
jgi:hypothetical protein